VQHDQADRNPELLVARQAVVLIVDGMGDLPVPLLHGKTPLEAASTPNLDWLAGAGRYGQIDPIAPGVTPNTDSGTGMLMGMRPEHAAQLRRGPVEAAGAGCRLQHGDVAMRANFASVQQVNGQMLVTDRRAGRIDIGHDVPQLIEILSEITVADDVTFQLRATDQHRAVLVMSGDDLGADISDTDPGDEIQPAPLLRSQARQAQSRRCADLLNQYLDVVQQILANHELNLGRQQQGKPLANALITRGAGAAVPIGNLIADAGIRAAVVSGCNTVRGLGKMFDFSIIRDARFTATRDTDIAAKIAAAITALQTHDLVFVHLKAPDLFAHDLQPLGKQEVLERFDAALAPLLHQGIVIACAADHSTDSNTGKHTADPVPALLYSPDFVSTSGNINFSETACRQGNMERQNSSAFLQRVLELM